MYKRILKSMVVAVCMISMFFTAKSDLFASTKKKADKIEISKKSISMSVDDEIFIGYGKDADVRVKITSSKKNKSFGVEIKDDNNVNIESVGGSKIKLTAIKSGTAKVKIVLRSNKKISKTLKVTISEKEEKVAGNVIEVSADTFDKEVLQAKGKVIVVYSATWCGHCVKFAPIYKKAAKEYPMYKFINVDADKNEDFLFSKEIFTVPTIHLYENGKLIDTDGPKSRKTVGDLIDWIENK